MHGESGTANSAQRRGSDLLYAPVEGKLHFMDPKKPDLDELVREELGDEPSQEAKDYARELYEKYRLPDPQTPAPREDT